MSETQDILLTDTVAMDRAMMRSFDHDQRLRVELTPISKAAVNPYAGREIPRWQQLGLDPDRVYHMFRDPNELKKAAKTSDSIPLLETHRPITPGDHVHEIVVGATGSDGMFDGTYLQNSLVVWVDSAINLIMADAKKELSCAYSYDAEMTPGMFGSTPYDGVMKNLKFNHVALVVEGRAGPDCRVADAMPSGLTEISGENRMAKVTLSEDAAKTADEDFENMDKAKDADLDAKDRAKDEDDDDAKDTKARDKRAKDKRAKDEEKDDDKKCEDEEKDDDEPDRFKVKDRAKDEAMTRALDAAVQAATIAVERRLKQGFRDLHEAEELVRPYTGNLIGMDSADDVYEAFFKHQDMGEVVTDVPKSAWKALANAQVNGLKKSASKVTHITSDSKRLTPSKSMAAKFPELAAVKIAHIYR